MTDQVLDILKLVLLALLYLFFARVLWAVWSEVRHPADARSIRPPEMPAAAPPPVAAGVPVAGRERREPKPAKGRGGKPGRLVVIEPRARRGAVFALGADVTIGREADNVIRIVDDSYISAHHAKVSVTDGQAVLDDLGSTNGTYHNGTRVTARRRLTIGDRIQLGYTVLEVQ